MQMREILLFCQRFFKNSKLNKQINSFLEVNAQTEVLFPRPSESK